MLTKRPMGFMQQVSDNNNALFLVNTGQNCVLTACIKIM